MNLHLPPLLLGGFPRRGGMGAIDGVEIVSEILRAICSRAGFWGGTSELAYPRARFWGCTAELADPRARFWGGIAKLPDPRARFWGGTSKLPYPRARFWGGTAELAYPRARFWGGAPELADPRARFWGGAPELADPRAGFWGGAPELADPRARFWGGIAELSYPRARFWGGIPELPYPRAGFWGGVAGFAGSGAMMARWDDPLTVWDQFFWDSPDSPQTAPKRRKKPNHRTMASNPTPDNNDILRALADRLADGCHQHEATLGIKQNMEADIRAAITTLDTAETQVGMKKLGVSDAYVALQAADDAGFTVLTHCKLRLAQKLGQRWSAAWEPTGFPNHSTAVPDTQDPRFTLLKDLKNYFTAVPANESADMGATAAICDAAWTVLSDARQGVANAESALTTAFNNRSAATDVLRKRVRGLINELDQLLAVDDPRWEDFGLNIPANPSAPEPVASVALEAMTNHRIGVSWPYSVRATRFGIDVKVIGVDDDFVRKTSVKDLEAILKGYTAGQVVRVRIVAGNDGGEAQASPEAEVTVT